MSFSPRDLNVPEGQLLGNKLFEMVNESNRRKVKYNIVTGITLEVISNPYDYLNRKIFTEGNETVRDLLTKRLKQDEYDIDGSLKSNALVDYMPMNTALANIIDNDHSGEPVICFPFFQSHISLPLKPGEHIWILEEVFQNNLSLYYWISRKTGFLQSEDLNFTNIEREKIITNIVGKFFNDKGAKSPSEESLKNAVGFNSSSDYIKSSLPDIFLNSTAYREEFTGEPVPRKAKECGDLLIQGSNNTGVHLTTEKFEFNHDPTQFTKALINKDTNAKRKPAAGAIDIFVARKKSAIDALKEEKVSDNKSIEDLYVTKTNIEDERFEYFESDKMADIRNKDLTIHNSEINDTKEDAVNVAGRLYISSNSNFDEVFNTNFDILDSKEGPASILFGKNTRIASEESARITSQLGQSFINLDSEGNITIKAAKGGAYISLKADGSISIVPGADGYIYLGDEESGANNVPIGNIENNNPEIPTEAIPITSTFGGVIGDLTPTTGNFSSKVRFK